MRRSMQVAALATAFVAATAGTSYANGFGPNGGGLLFADNSHHTFTYVDLSPEFNSSMNWARVDALGARTDMTEAYVGRTSDTDVVAHDGFYGGTWLGSARCVSQSGTDGDRCQQWEVLLNQSNFVGRSQDERTKTAVHEVGHTVGLGHSTESTSPMQQGYFTIITYSGHDASHINGKY